MMKRKLTPTEKRIRDKAIYEDYLKLHYTLAEIAERYGLNSRASAWYIIQKEKKKEKGVD